MSKYIHFDEIDSTSSYLKRNYKNYDSFTFVSSDHQSDGHGRVNRLWYNTKGKDLLFSILIKEKKITENYTSLSLVSAKAVMDVLCSLNIENISYKWPNDVYVNDKKISGILLEGISSSNEIEAIILGVGINVNSECFNEEIKDKATSIFIESKEKFDILELKKKFYNSFEQNISNMTTSKYLENLRDKNYLLNKNVYVMHNNEKVLVNVIDINEDNSLKVNFNGEIINIYSGEVTFDNK